MSRVTAQRALLMVAGAAVLGCARGGSDTSAFGPPGSATAPSSVRLSHTGYTEAVKGARVAGSYTTRILVGSPPQAFDVALDTGSAHLILLGDSSVCPDCSGEAGERYAVTASTTAELTGNTFAVHYGSGDLGAREVRDHVTVAGFDSLRYTFAVMSEDHGIPNVWGLGYPRLARLEGVALEPYFDALVERLGIPDVFSMLLCGHERGGRLDLGGWSVEPTAHMRIAAEFWYVVEPDHLVVKGTGERLGAFPRWTGPESPKTLIDSGSTELALPRPMFEGLVEAIESTEQGARLTEIRRDGVLLGFSVPEAVDLSGLPTFQVVAGGVGLDIAPETYLRRAFGDTWRLAVSASTGDAILGQPFMENHYTVFDRARRRIGFAPVGSSCDDIVPAQ